MKVKRITSTIACNAKAKRFYRGCPIEYVPVDEAWGVRRFYVRDPFGKLVNVLAHSGGAS